MYMHKILIPLSYSLPTCDRGRRERERERPDDYRATAISHYHSRHSSFRSLLRNRRFLRYSPTLLSGDGYFTRTSLLPFRLRFPSRARETLSPCMPDPRKALAIFSCKVPPLLFPSRPIALPVRRTRVSVNLRAQFSRNGNFLEFVEMLMYAIYLFFFLL